MAYLFEQWIEVPHEQQFVNQQLYSVTMPIQYKNNFRGLEDSTLPGKVIVKK